MAYGTSDKYHRIDPSECEKNTKTNKHFGGPWANAVFSNNLYVEPEPELPYTYVGCYRDDGERNLKDYKGDG